MSWRRRRDGAAHDRVSAALARAEPVLVERFTTHGVIGVEFVVGFVRPYSVWVWLVTASDAERDKLGDDLPLFDEVREILRAAGLPTKDAHFTGTTTQSQETVDRDYQGNWFYALR